MPFLVNYRRRLGKANEQPEYRMSTKVLLDTDIDILGDIDDVMCLAYRLAQPQCELVGITT